MLVAGDERGIVLARQGGDPDVIFWNRVTAALQLMAYLGIQAGTACSDAY